MTLGGAMREEGVGVGGAAFKGRHGIRYEQTHSDSWLEDVNQKADEDQPATSLPTSSSLGQLASPSVAGTITEEGGVSAEGEEGDGAEQESIPREDAGDSDHGAPKRSIAAKGQQQSPNSGGEQLGVMRVDTGFKSSGSGSGGGGGPPIGQISPASDFRRGSMSPGLATEGRPRTHSWTATAAAASPPVLRGPFSRARSRSRSPRHRMSVTMCAPGGFHVPRKAEYGRLSSGGTSGGGERTPGLSKDPSVSSTAEEGVGWNEGDGGGSPDGLDGVGGGGDGMKPAGPFTETSLEMARLRLPHMELGFEEDGFFGIDVRSLIIGREIARGAYGVVHEGKLLPAHSNDEGVEGGGKSAASGAAEGETSASAEGEAEADVTRTAEGGEGAAGHEEGIGDAAVAGSKEAKGEDVSPEGTSTARSVAVKIQQVPEDEEEQANLLGELAMLRNYKHSHLVEFIGTAMAVERGADTVMVAMELCTNGALREALKLSISWPLKVRIASDMTDGLQYLHQHGIIHRDIKTPNVLIDSSWRAKLCDYNFAIDETSSIKQDFCAGTAEFMSPEVLLSEEYGLPSDVFSLGMIFVEMLTGQEPSPSFPERPPQTFFVVSEDEIEEQLLPDYPQSFSLLQSQCLFAEPAERPTAEDAFNWLQDLVNETGEDNIVLPQSGPPLPVLTEGAAIAREGNVINASPKGNEHHWFDADTMEQQIDSMVENAVERALVDRGRQDHGLVDRGTGDSEKTAKLDEMREEIDALRAACEERDSRISDLEVQALRNTSTLKMLSSALEVAYKMLEAQQAALSQPNWNNTSADEASTERGSFSAQEHDDFDAVEARLAQVPNP
ncbi:unnamed protein product [Scytosiphon promiscuus]